LVEMARLEWAYVRAFDVRDDPPLSQDQLARIPPEAWPHARFEISSTVSLFRFEYPVADLRRAFRASPRSVRRDEIKTDPHHLIVYRRQRTLWDKRLSRAAFLL